jgi:nitroreductase
MEAYEAITTRHSVRKYTEQAVSDDVLKELLTAAMNGPSAVNQRPWQFIVVTDKAQLEALAGAIKTGRYLKNAALAIVVCGDLQLEKAKGYWVQDCSIASQNILLAAHAKDLGAVWVGGGVPHEDRVAAVSKILGLPEHVIPLNVISIGYSAAEERTAKDRYDESRVHYNTW